MRNRCGDRTGDRTGDGGRANGAAASSAAAAAAEVTVSEALETIPAAMVALPATQKTRAEQTVAM